MRWENVGLFAPQPEVRHTDRYSDNESWRKKMKSKMNRLVTVVVTMLFALTLTTQVFAESSSKEECIAKSMEAAQMLIDN